jgi:hypothetical protein
MKILATFTLTILLAACASCQLESDPFVATELNDVLSLRAYLDRGGDPNAKSSHGESLLYVATGPHGGEDVLRLLLERGANPNIGAGGYTPANERLLLVLAQGRVAADRGRRRSEGTERESGDFPSDGMLWQQQC